VVVSQGDVCWIAFPDPTGSAPGYSRPAIIVQGDALNASGLATVVIVPMTSNLRWASARENVLLSSERTGLPAGSVANVSQIVSIDRGLLTERIGHLDEAETQSVLAGIDIVLGRH
jgi:mRNA interferase MazF